MANINLVKKTYGVNTYSKAIDTSFKELVTPPQAEVSTEITVEQFFNYYLSLIHI